MWHKIITLFLFLSLSLGLSSQNLRDSVYFAGPLFGGYYSEVLEQPIFLTYDVPCPGETESRRGLDFFKVDSIHTSDDADYYNNIWDKGHLAPAGSFGCSPDTLKMTFSYLNCVLQHQSLNRGEWKKLEAFERDLAKRGANVRVEVNVIFTERSEKLPTGATVPRAFVKHVFINGVPMCFFFFNEKPNSEFMLHRIDCKKH